MTPVNRLGVLALACVAVLGAACAREPDGTSAPPDPGTPGLGSSGLGPPALGSPALGSPVVREGVVYTPVGIGPRGCVLYNVRVPGGQAPAALAYRSVEGRFAYGRPERCVKKADPP